MANKVITRNGMVVTGPGGIASCTADASAPNGTNLGETVSILTVGGARQVSVTLPVASYAAYSALVFVWRARDGSGAEIADTWTMRSPASGTTVLGPADVPADGSPAVLGTCTGTEPRYEMCAVDTSGRIGYSRGLQTITFDTTVSFTVNANPILPAPQTAGNTIAYTPLDYTGDPDVTVTYKVQPTEDTSSTNPGTETDSTLVPDIAGAKDCFRINAYAYGPGTSEPSGPYSSNSIAITAASVSTPVTQTRATIIASIRIPVDGITGAVPPAGGTLTSGSASATIVAYVAETATTGTIYTGPVANSTIADNAALSWTGGSGLANGAQAAWQITAGEPFYILPAAFDGDVSDNVLRQEIATDSSGTGATLVDLTGSMPPHYGTKYYRYTRRVSGYGIANPPGYQDYSTAWTAIGIPTLAALADVDWPVISCTAVTGGTRVDYVLVRAALNAAKAWWTTRSAAQIVANPFPDGFEAMTLDGTVSITVTTIAVDGMTGSAPLFNGTLTAGSKTATIYAFVPGSTANTGTIYASALSSGTIADNEALTWTGGGGSANGASSAAAVSHQKWKVNPAIYNGVDYSIFGTTSQETARRALFGVIVEIGGAMSPMGNRKTVPTLAATTASDFARYINRSQTQEEQGTVGGCDMQFPRGVAVDGEYVFATFDVTGPCESFDFGDNWQVDDNNGLWISQTTTGACAFDSKYVVAIFGPLFMRSQGNHDTKEGIYRKNRLTNQWTFVQALSGVYGSNDQVRYNHAHVCVQKGSGTTSENRILWALSVPSDTANFTTIQVYKSTDSGATWATDGGTISVGTHGYPIKLIADSTALYMCTKTGVSRRPIGGTTWTQATWPAGVNGIRHRVEKHGTTIYASSQQDGLYTATDAATLAFTLKKAFTNAREFAVCPTNTARIIITGHASSPTTTAGLSVYTGDNGTTWTGTPSQQFPGQPNDFAHKLGGESVWPIWHQTDPDKVISQRFQHPGKSTSWPPSFAWSSNNRDYSEFRGFGFDLDDYKRMLCGMTDRLFTATDHGAAFVMDDAISTANKDDIRAALGGGSFALTVRGPLILTRGTRTGYVGLVGKNIQAKIPVVVGRLVSTDETDTAATGNGNISVTASPDLPAGEYTLTCTTAATNGGTFTGLAPMGVSMGTWTVGASKTYTDPRGGTLQVTISDGSVDFKAGATPKVFTITVNPIGGARTLFTSATTDPGFFSGTNPATHYRGCSGKNVFEMAADGTITILRSLTNPFVGYAGPSGNIILGYGASGGTIYRNTSEGSGSWTTMASGLGTVNGLGKPALCASRHSDTRCYAGLNNGKALRVDGATKTTIFDFDAWCTLNGVSGNWPGSTQINTRWVPIISGVAESAYNPNLVYVSTYLYGAPYTLFRTENALDAAPTWTNITRDAAGRGLVQPIQGIMLHPVTDELFLFSAHGTVMVRPKESHRTTYGITKSLVDDLRAMPGGSYTSTQPI